MATSLPIRGLFRPSPSTTCSARAGLALIHLHRPAILPPHHPATTLPAPAIPTTAPSSSSAPFSTSAAAQAERRGPMFNWLKVKKIKKSYKAKSALNRGPKAKKPAPGDRKAFRKRIVLSNNSALAVPDLPELGPSTMLSLPTRRISRAEAGPATMLAEAEGGSDVWAEGEVRDIVSIARGMVALPGLLVDKLRVLEAFKSSQPWGLFRKPHFLVRGETVKLVGLMQQAVRDRTALRMVIEGKASTGKSMLLLQAISHALMNNWVVIHIPEAQDLVNGNTEYSPIPGTSPMQFAQPVYVLRLLERIHDANEALLRSLPLSREYRTELLHVPMGSSLADLALAAREAESAWPLFLTLWRELVSVPGRPPVLLSCDGIAHWARNSAYRDPRFNIVHAHEMALPRHFLSALSPTGYGAPGPIIFPNGGAVLTTVGGNNSPHVPALDLAIRQNLAMTRGDTDIPQSDPYERRYDHRVLDSLRGVPAMSVGGVDRDEARAVIEYWAASGLLRTAVTENVVSEKWTLGGSGVLGEMERATLVNMRIGWT